MFTMQLTTDTRVYFKMEQQQKHNLQILSLHVVCCTASSLVGIICMFFAIISIQYIV